MSSTEAFAIIHIGQRGKIASLRDTAVAARVGNRVTHLRHVPPMTNCDAVWHAAELALDVAAGRPIIITTCMPGLRGGNASEIYDESSSYDVVARVHYKLHRSGSRVEFQHKKESPALEKTFNTLTRRCHECLDGKLPLPIQTPDPDETRAAKKNIEGLRAPRKRRREVFLRERGWKILRFPASQAMNHPVGVAAKVMAHVAA